MTNRTAWVLLLALAVAVAPLAPISPGFQGGDDPATTSRSGPFESLEERLVGSTDGDAAPADPVRQEVYVMVRMKRGRTPEHPGFDIRRVYDREGARVAGGYVPLTAVRDLSNDPRVEAVRIERSRWPTGDPPATRPDGNVAAGVSAVGADRLQLAGVTGRNVTVGVIDSGFRVSDPEIADHVGAYRSFDEGGDWVHGTAVASVVADTAPGARLHLAAVGGSTTSGEYRDAVAWLRESGADVIVDAGSYFGQPGDGSGEIARVAAAASRDAVFVAAAGNYGQRHWRGTHDPGHDAARVQFAPGETANYLEGGAPFAGSVSATLRWDDWNATDGNRSDYDLQLLRRQPGADAVVATGTELEGEPAEHLAARVPRGRYYLAVRATNATDATDADTLHLFASRGLTHRSPRASLTAPGTAPGVLTVGALDGNDSVAAFSSRGPVAGTDRPGVDLVAPDDVALPGASPGAGSSYAAPYVAGTAALLVDAHPSFAPREVRAVLRNSATDLGPVGRDVASGYGRLDAAAAAEFAVEYDRYDDLNVSTATRD